MIINIVSAIATFLSLLGNYLVICKKIIGFPVWIASNILWIIVNFLGEPNLSQIFMFIVYAATSGYGWYKWSVGNNN
jgi:nicotinamide riboside transporter PnuC